MPLREEGKTGRFKISIFLVITFLLSISPSLVQAQKDLSALVKKVVPSVVVINVYDIKGKIQSLGTGFSVTAEGELITNYHIIEGG
jgi:S1-C subfamily serine protease